MKDLLQPGLSKFWFQIGQHVVPPALTGRVQIVKRLKELIAIESALNYVLPKSS